MNKKIAVLGATSHIAKGLIYNFARENKCKLFLFARSPGRVNDFLRINSLKGDINITGFKDFQHKEYDFIINCVGLGTPVKVKENSFLVFSLTEDYDRLIFTYLSKFKKSCYINFSSGVVYGNSFPKAVCESSLCKISVNNIKPQEYYSIAKINSEVKHRAKGNLNIVDIRIFAYFSRFIDLDAGYFLTDLINSIKQKKEFITNACDFTRDYLHPSDLFALVKLIIKKNTFNAAIDAYSRAPVSKFKLLEYFSKIFSLKYKIDKKLNFACATGEKSVYCSSSRKAAGLGYQPRFSSLDAVAAESKYILGEASE